MAVYTQTFTKDGAVTLQAHAGTERLAAYLKNKCFCNVLCIGPVTFFKMALSLFWWLIVKSAKFDIFPLSFSWWKLNLGKLWYYFPISNFSLTSFEQSICADLIFLYKYYLCSLPCDYRPITLQTQKISTIIFLCLKGFLTCKYNKVVRLYSW